MKNKINKLDKTRRLMKLSQEVGMDLRSVQDAADMIIDIDEFFENHLPNQKRDPAWDNFDVVDGYFVRKQER